MLYRIRIIYIDINNICTPIESVCNCPNKPKHKELSPLSFQRGLTCRWQPLENHYYTSVI